MKRQENKYGGACDRCGVWVEAGVGLARRNGSAWVVTHETCAQTRQPVQPTVVEVASTTEKGRKWLAYWWIRGIRPRPKEVTIEMLDEMLGDADLAEMDRQVAKARTEMGA